MKICIIGGSGVIGSKMVQFFSENGHDTFHTYNTHRTNSSSKEYQLDITDSSKTVNFLKKINPEIIIYSSAITNIDLCETDKELAYKVNVKGIENTVKGCKEINGKLVYLSTSFVYDGNKKEYYEEDKPSPSTYYGYTKMKGEEITKDSQLEYLILRTDQPYCWVEKWQHTNSILRVLDTLRAGKILNEVEDWYNTPTYVPEIVLATSELLKNKSNGIFHVVGSDFINRYKWSIEVAKIFGYDQTKINPINSKELKLAVKRVNVNLKNSKILKETGLKIKGIKSGAILMKNERSEIQ